MSCETQCLSAGRGGTMKAYALGVVRSVQDEITGEILAVKMVTRIFEKVQLAKRALREITLLRHFNNHENVCITYRLQLSSASKCVSARLPA